MGWNKVTEVETLKKQIKLKVFVNDLALLLIYDQNRVYAINDRCPHLGASLEKGTYDDGVVTCAKHHAQIDVKTGEVLEKAKILFLKMPTKKTKTYETKIEEGTVFVKV